MHKRFLILALCLFAAGCGPIYDTVYSYAPPRSAEGRMCTNQCQQISQMCEQNCSLKDDNCRAQAHQDAERQYHDYVHERKKKNKKIDKSVSDFEYTGHCPSSSNCESKCNGNYRTCYSNCGGTVTSQRVCTMFCDGH
ncbi:MAG: hypothetical protein WCF85_03400 [Rhodospirillaceae bacterium]